MRTVLTSPDRLFLDCLAALFAGRFNIVASSTNNRESVAEAQRALADLLVFDLEGATLGDIQFLLGAQEFGNFRTLVIADSSGGIPDGFAGSVSRSDSGQVMLERATALCADIVRVEPRRKGRRESGEYPLGLSKREYEAATLIARGFTNHQIAETLALKEQSVKNMVSSLNRKLKCENRVQVALLLSRGVRED